MTNLLKPCAVALAVVLGLLAAAPARGAEITIGFENSGASGGTISYDGAGGPAVGTGIGFDEVTFDNDVDPLVVLTCVGCFLNFETGANTLELGGTIWTWDVGGSFVIEGTVLAPDDSVIASGVLLEGFFDGPVPASASLGLGGLLRFSGGGLDVKNEDLLAYFGISNNEFIYATTEITTRGCTPAAVTFAFNCAVEEADVTNTNTGETILVPEPGMLTLFGVGLLGACWQVRRRVAQRRAA